MRTAASIANLRLLGLVRDSHALAVNYALEHCGALADDAPPHVVALVDIGASSARLVVARFTRHQTQLLATRASRAVSGRAVDHVVASLACAALACSTSAIGVTRLLVRRCRSLGRTRRR